MRFLHMSGQSRCIPGLARGLPYDMISEGKEGHTNTQYTEKHFSNPEKLLQAAMR